MGLWPFIDPDRDNVQPPQIYLEKLLRSTARIAKDQNDKNTLKFILDSQVYQKAIIEYAIRAHQALQPSTGLTLGSTISSQVTISIEERPKEPE